MCKFFAQLIIINKMSDSSHCSSITKEKSMRRREKPNKKWSEEEVRRIVNFLRKNQQSFEMPTAQIFYKKMIREEHIDAEWNLIRWKVRNMRTAYNKAAQWKNGIGADILEEQAIQSIEQRLYKLCPHFNTLENIFSKSKPSLCSVYDNANYDEKTQSFCVPVGEVQQSSQVNDSVVDVLEPELLPVKSETNVKASTFVRKTAPNTAVSRLSDMPLDRNELQMQRLQFDKERHLEETLRENKRLRLETERLNMEMERQDKMMLIEAEKLALEREKIRIMERELEMKESLARYELELKYIFRK